MHTVESIIESVYKTTGDAANALNVVPSAVSNWKANGHFPARVLIPICQHARERGVPLDVTDIPIMPAKEAAQ